MEEKEVITQDSSCFSKAEELLRQGKYFLAMIEIELIEHKKSSVNKNSLVVS